VLCHFSLVFNVDFVVYKLRDLSFLRTLLAFRKTLQPMFSKKRQMFQNANLLLACI
jgi:hypothetical protein